MPCPLLIVSQSDFLIQIVDINSHTKWQTVQIQISWLLQKPTELVLHCLQRQNIFGFSRTRVNNFSFLFSAKHFKYFSEHELAKMRKEEGIPVVVINQSVLVVLLSFSIMPPPHSTPNQGITATSPFHTSFNKRSNLAHSQKRAAACANGKSPDF